MDFHLHFTLHLFNHTQPNQNPTSLCLLFFNISKLYTLKTLPWPHNKTKKENPQKNLSNISQTVTQGPVDPIWHILENFLFSKTCVSFKQRQESYTGSKETSQTAKNFHAKPNP